MTYISDILFWISTGLLVPVIVLLIVLFLRSLLLAGSFFGQYLSYRRQDTLIRQSLDRMTKENAEEEKAQFPSVTGPASPFYGRLLTLSDNSAAQGERIVAEYEIAADADLSTAKTLAKMGPVLGLMGTLIPMGPALVGLSTGDIASMAYNMQVAFATTVVGLFAGAVGTLVLQVKKRWYAQDLANLEFLTALLTTKRSI